jgi:hypothetical protein
MKVVVLKTPEEKTAGVRAFPSPLPEDFVLLFTDVLPGQKFVMDGVTQKLAISFLGKQFNEIVSYSLWPGGFAVAPPGTVYAVEVPDGAPTPDFQQVRNAFQSTLNPPSGLSALGRLTQ